MHRLGLVPALTVLCAFAGFDAASAQPVGGQLMDINCQTTNESPPPRPLPEHIEKKIVDLLKSSPKNHTPLVAVLDAGIMSPVDPRFSKLLWKNILEQQPRGKKIFDDDNNGYTDDVIGVDVGDPHRIPLNLHDPSGIGHGTHILGIVTARLLPELGPLVEERTKVMVVRVLDDDGTVQGGALLKGIEYAHRQKANIINLSLAGPCDDFAAVVASVEKQSSISIPTLYVTAAGNTGTSIDEVCPARLSKHSTAGAGVISVAAQGADLDSLAAFSNFGADLAAPGVGIPSTGSFANAVCAGTSQAAALVTLTALLLHSMEGWEPALIKERIVSSADHRVGLKDRVASSATLNIVKALLIHDDLLERKDKGLYIGTVKPTKFKFSNESGTLELPHVRKIVFLPDGSHRIARFDGASKTLQFSSVSLLIDTVTIEGLDPAGNPGKFDIPAAEIVDIVPRSIHDDPGGI